MDLLAHPVLNQYLADRWAELDQSDQKWLPYHSNTARDPHTCRFCKGITVDIGKSDVTRLDCGIGNVAYAARNGCSLYQAFVDIVVRGKHSKTYGHDARFSEYRGFVFAYVFTAREETQVTTTSTLRLLVFGQLGDGSQQVVGAHSDSPILYCWASESDAAALDIEARPFESDLTSQVSIRFAKDCLRLCRSEHSSCRPPTCCDLQQPEMINKESIPSRLLEISTDGSVHSVKLVGKDCNNEIDHDRVSSQGYAILSYCWGGPQPIQLTGQSINELSAGIAASVLPQTIRDAVWFTSAIGIRYLWVDALCIYQDDADDKITEISRMADYYSGSTVTLCAASATRCTDGFLQQRQERPTAYSIGPIQLHAVTSSGAQGMIQAFKEDDMEYLSYDDYDARRAVEPTTLRGWTLQESLLSRRILIFSSSKLLFTCTVANATCGGPETRPTDRMMSSYQSDVAGIHTLSGLRHYPVQVVWEKVVIEYSRRQLGLSSDKLPAISALASTIISIANDRGQNIVYLAGLMITVEDNFEWRQQLLWMSSNTGETYEVHSRCPSWAWSSLDGPVMPWNWGRPLAWHGSDDTQLLDHQIQLKNSTAYLGEVLSGSIRVRTRLRALNSIAKYNVKVITKRKWMSERHYPEESTLLLCPDTTIRKQLIERALLGQQSAALLEIIPFHERDTSPGGLIVTRSVTDDQKYVRIGMFEYQLKEIRRVDQTEEEADRFLRSSLFINSSYQEVVII